MPSRRKQTVPSTLIPYKCCGCISKTDLKLQRRKNAKAPLNITRSDGPYQDHLHRVRKTSKLILRTLFYERFFSQIKTMVSTIDNRWPTNRSHCDHSKSNSRQETENRIRDENTTIWTTINDIMSTKSHMDTRNPMAGHHLDEYQIQSRAMADRIDKENRELYGRLAKIVSNKML